MYSTVTATRTVPIPIRILLPMLLATALILALPALPTTPFRVTGTGFVTDSGHPKHPGDFQRYDATLTLTMDPEAGIAKIEIETRQGDQKDLDTYYVRRGRIFQTDDEGKEPPARNLGDVSAPAVAALHPALTASAVRERANDARDDGKSAAYLAWNDVLWRLSPSQLTRNDANPVLGDSVEKVSYVDAGVKVTPRDRETASFTFGPTEPAAPVAIPEGDERRDRGYVIRAAEIAFTEIAPHLFTIDLASISS